LSFGPPSTLLRFDSRLLFVFRRCLIPGLAALKTRRPSPAPIVIFHVSRDTP